MLDYVKLAGIGDEDSDEDLNLGEADLLDAMMLKEVGGNLNVCMFNETTLQGSHFQIEQPEEINSSHPDIYM